MVERWIPLESVSQHAQVPSIGSKALLKDLGNMSKACASLDSALFAVGNLGKLLLFFWSSLICPLLFLIPFLFDSRLHLRHHLLQVRPSSPKPIQVLLWGLARGFQAAGWGAGPGRPGTCGSPSGASGSESCGPCGAGCWPGGGHSALGRVGRVGAVWHCLAMCFRLADVHQVVTPFLRVIYRTDRTEATWMALASDFWARHGFCWHAGCTMHSRGFLFSRCLKHILSIMVPSAATSAIPLLLLKPPSQGPMRFAPGAGALQTSCSKGLPMTQQ